MSLTRLQTLDYVRASIGELDFNKLKPLLVNQLINTEQRAVQKDLMPLIGMKNFIKEANYSSHIFAQPSDLMAIPNSIINLRYSFGTRAYKEATSGATNGNIKLTAKHPGTQANGYICLISVPIVEPSAIQIVWAYTTTVDFNAYVKSTTTATQLIEAMNADPLFSNYFTASLADGNSGAGIVGEETLILANGTGADWKNANEVSLEEFIRISNNTYLMPTVTQPVYARKGNSDSDRIIHVLPEPTTISADTNLQYYYTCPDLTADTDTLSIPVDYEDLLLTKLEQKCYELLAKQAENEIKKVEYATKVKEYESKYVNFLGSLETEKTRIKTNDK